MYRLWLACAVFALLLAGCAAQQPVSLSPQAHKAIGSVQAVLYVTQNDLDVDVTPGNPGGTGLLGVLLVQAVDANRRANAQKAQVGVVRAIDGFDFRGRMARQLNAEFGRVPSPRLQSVQLETVDSESQRRIAYDRSSASAILFTNVTYQLVDGKLVVTATNRIYPKAPVLKALRTKPDDSHPLDDGNAIYRTKFSFVKQSVTAENVRAGLTEGLANVAWQLAADLAHVATGTAGTLSAPLPVASAGPEAAPTAAVAATPRVETRPDAQLPQLEDAMAVPYMAERGRSAYRTWLTRPLPRAFAVSVQGEWAAAWGPKPADPSMPIDVAARALAICQARHLQCELYAVNRDIVYRRSAGATEKKSP